MKESIIGGIFMARSYRHISEYEKDNNVYVENGEMFGTWDLDVVKQ